MTATPPQGIPIIDIAPFLAGSPEGKRQVAREVGRACEEIGFFLVTGPQRPRSADPQDLRPGARVLRPAGGREAAGAHHARRRRLYADRAGGAGRQPGQRHARRPEGVDERRARLRAGPLACPPGRRQGDLDGLLPGAGGAGWRDYGHLRAGARSARGLLRGQDRPAQRLLPHDQLPQPGEGPRAWAAARGRALRLRQPDHPADRGRARRPAGAQPRRRVGRWWRCPARLWSTSAI